MQSNLLSRFVVKLSIVIVLLLISSKTAASAESTLPSLVLLLGTNNSNCNRNRNRNKNKNYHHYSNRNRSSISNSNSNSNEGISEMATSAGASAGASAVKPIISSFYQRKLPSTCVPFASKEGKKIFASALNNSGLKSFFPLIQQFTTQSEPAFCGLSTLVLVLNALAVDPRQNWKGPWRWYEESMLNCCVDLEQVKQSGITLRDFQCLAHCQGLSVDLNFICQNNDHYHTKKEEYSSNNDSSSSTSTSSSNHCNANANANASANANADAIHKDSAWTSCAGATLEDFRDAVRRACIETNDNHNEDENDDDNDDKTNETNNQGKCDQLEVLVVSYSRKVMGQTGSGHFSPIAAYDVESDSILILDTARFKYGAHWAKLPLMYEAMKPIDPDTGRSRGYALLSFNPPSDQAQNNNDDENKTTTDKVQPLSRLFRSPMSRRRTRKEYKQFLSSLSQNQTHENDAVAVPATAPVSWEQVMSYLTRNGSDPHWVWKIVEPLRSPVDQEENKNVKQMLSLLKEMLAAQGGNPMCCAPTKHNEGPFSIPVPATAQVQVQVPCVGSETAMYAIYLASLPENIRRDKIMNFESQSDVSNLTRERLICEAELLAIAIDTSDQVSL